MWEWERRTLFHQKDRILLPFKASQGLPGSSWHQTAWKTADCLVFLPQLWVELHKKKQVLVVNQRICNRWIRPVCGRVSNQCQMWMQISCLLVVYWNVPSSRLWWEAGAERPPLWSLRLLLICISLIKNCFLQDQSSLVKQQLCMWLNLLTKGPRQLWTILQDVVSAHWSMKGRTAFLQAILKIRLL